MTGQSVWAFRVVLIITVAAIMAGLWESSTLWSGVQAINTFQVGDGLTNRIVPTSGGTWAMLALSTVSYVQ